MASKRQLKKDLNNAFGELIEASLIWQNQNSDADHKNSEKIIDDAISAFDDINAKINQRDVENVKTHFSEINTAFESKVNALAERINKL